MSRPSERSDVDDQYDLVLVLLPIDRVLLVNIFDLVVVDRSITSARMVAECLARTLVVAFCSHHEEGGQKGGQA